mmetsp:Transcript_358/g.1150  ORF Transcript_358/g.1150 Transcript_358/m.1150 type:complete len:326 (+) Transcript_358:3025-4002(+)
MPPLSALARHGAQPVQPQWWQIARTSDRPRVRHAHPRLCAPRPASAPPPSSPSSHAGRTWCLPQCQLQARSPPPVLEARPAPAPSPFPHGVSSTAPPTPRRRPPLRLLRPALPWPPPPPPALLRGQHASWPSARPLLQLTSPPALPPSPRSADWRWPPRCVQPRAAHAGLARRFLCMRAESCSPPAETSFASARLPCSEAWPSCSPARPRWRGAPSGPLQGHPAGSGALPGWSRIWPQSPVTQLRPRPTSTPSRRPAPGQPAAAHPSLQQPRRDKASPPLRHGVLRATQTPRRLPRLTRTSQPSQPPSHAALLQQPARRPPPPPG